MGPPLITKEPYEEQSVIKVQAQGTKPMKYQWLKDDKELRDSIDYKGSTTPELCIMGSGSHAKGNYRCQVTNMFGKTLSQEILYGASINLTFVLYNIFKLFSDPFISELKLKGLRSNEISKLIGK